MLKRAEGVPEVLDGAVPVADRAATLADVARLSAWFGGYALSERAIARIVSPALRPFVVVDVGGGRGDFARRLVGWAARHGRRAQVIVIDREPDALLLAWRADGLSVVQADATALPFRAEAVEVVTTALTLHHLEPDEVVGCLREMARVARCGVVVNDLLRSRLSLGLVWLATRLGACHRISRHDGPLSVRRAYSAAELRALAARADIRALTVRQYPLLGRLVAVARR